MPDTEVTIVLLVVAAVVIWFTQLHLITEVHDDEIVVHFKWLWKAKRIEIGDVREAAAVTYRPLLDYGGWGIRLGRKGWAYNVSGNRGVELGLRNENNLMIGSQEPENLAAAIQERMTTPGARRNG
jgi:hypothetical protein